MTKNICPCCNQTIKTRKEKAGAYTSVQLESGNYLWITPYGTQFTCSFEADKVVNNGWKRKQELKKKYDTANRNAKLGFTFDDVTNSLWGIRENKRPLMYSLEAAYA